MKKIALGLCIIMFTMLIAGYTWSMSTVRPSKRYPPNTDPIKLLQDPLVEEQIMCNKHYDLITSGCFLGILGLGVAIAVVETKKEN